MSKAHHRGIKNEITVKALVKEFTHRHASYAPGVLAHWYPVIVIADFDPVPAKNYSIKRRRDLDQYRLVRKQFSQYVPIW